MKKALKINLSGRIFHIDEDAYEKLKNYLDTISSHFSNVEESKEIIDDIEARIAELLQELLSDESQVITIGQVNEIIEIMGKPEEIIDDEQAGEHAKKEYYSRNRQYRKLYRDPDNSVLGGVAAGISAYFAIDLLVVRILFVVFTLLGWGFPFVLYLVLWIAIPKAQTAAEKLEMRGEKVNVSNLEKKVKEEYEDVKENFKKARNSKAGRKTEDAFHEIFRILGVIIVGFLKIILAFIAIGFIIAGISLIASIVGLAFFGAGFGSWGLFHIWDTDIHNYIVPFVDPLNLSFIGITGILVVLIPVLAIIYGLFKALFRFKARDKALGAGAFAIWILALISVISLGANELRNFKYDEEVVSSIPVKDLDNDTLIISLLETPEDFLEDRDEFYFDDQRYFVGSDQHIYGGVEIDFRQADTDYFELEIEKASRGKDYEEAIDYAGKLDYSFSVEGNQLKLNPYFKSENDRKWRLQQVEATIYVPEGKAIRFDREVAEFVDYIRNDNHYSSHKMAEKVWIMKDGKFVRE